MLYKAYKVDVLLNLGRVKDYVFSPINFCAAIQKHMIENGYVMNPPTAITPPMALISMRTIPSIIENCRFSFPIL